jgi:uncharacterized protein with FMN-binding domain
MELFLNFGFAWISIILTISLSIIYVLRKIISKLKSKNIYLIKLNSGLRQYHKVLGIFLVETGIIHGYFSSESVFSLRFGTAAWVISILLALSWTKKNALSKYKGWIYYHRVLAVMLILIIVLHIVQVGGIQVHRLLLGTKTYSGQKFSISQPSKRLEGATFKDGAYNGEADAYRPGLKVSIEIKNNSIVSIEIVEHNEVNLRLYQRAFKNIPQAILDNQSTNVDAVSGSTFTSIGIMNAVNNALSQALIQGNLPSSQQLPQNRRTKGSLKEK